MKYFFEIIGVICIGLALLFLYKEEAAYVALFMGLAVYNHITSDRYD